MALSTPLTTEIIHQTADQLQLEGIRPTQNNIRERLGGGSFTTIANAMKTWKHEQQATAQLERITIPDDLSERLRLLGAEAWETAQTLANERLQKEREALQHKEALMADELEQYKQTITTLEAEQSESLSMLDDLTAQLDQVTASNAEYIKTIDEINKNNIEQGNKLQSLNEKLTIERDKSAQLQDKLDQLTTNNADLQATNATLQANLAHANTDITRLTAILDEQKAQHDTQLATLNSELSKAKNDLATATNNAQTDKDKANSAYATLQADNANLQGKLEVLGDQLKQSTKEKTDLQAKLDSYIKQITQASAEQKGKYGKNN